MIKLQTEAQGEKTLFRKPALFSDLIIFYKQAPKVSRVQQVELLRLIAIAKLLK